MMYILDTNVISELRKSGNGKANPNVMAWSETVDTARLFVSVITLMELEMGVLQIERKDPTQGAMLRNWLNQQVLPEFSHKTLAIDTEVAMRCASLHIPNKHSERDAFIAASALVHGMAIVTRNIADFKASGVALINPWEPLD